MWHSLIRNVLKAARVGSRRLCEVDSRIRAEYAVIRTRPDPTPIKADERCVETGEDLSLKLQHSKQESG